jgi:hypothetical protein
MACKFSCSLQQPCQSVTPTSCHLTKQFKSELANVGTCCSQTAPNLMTSASTGSILSAQVPWKLISRVRAKES